jgi:hypothetical protein
VLESSKLVEDHKSRSMRLKIEYRMQSVPLELPSKKVLSWVEDVRYCMLLVLWTAWNPKTQNRSSVSTSSKEPFPSHAKPSLITQVSKESQLLRKSTKAKT